MAQWKKTSYKEKLGEVFLTKKKVRIFFGAHYNYLWNVQFKRIRIEK